MECAQTTRNATTAAGLSCKSLLLSLVSGLPTSVSCVEVPHVLRNGLDDCMLLEERQGKYKIRMRIIRNSPLRFGVLLGDGRSYNSRRSQ